jgi:hypothetical protein
MLCTDIEHCMVYTKKAIFLIVLVCGVGDAAKPGTFALNCQLFRTNSAFYSKVTSSCVHQKTKQQKQNRCTPHPPCQ